MQNKTTEIWRGLRLPFILIFICFATSRVRAADSPELLLSRADSLFSAKRFSEASVVYNQLFTSGYVTPGSLLRAAWIQEGRGDVPGALMHLYRYHQITNDAEAWRKITKMASDAGLNGYELSEFQQWHLSLAPYVVWVTVALVLAVLGIQVFAFQRKRQGKGQLGNGWAYVNLGLLAAVFVLVNYGSPPRHVFVQAAGGILMKDASIAADRGPSARPGDLFEYDGEQDVWVRVKRNDDIFFVRKNQIELI